MIKITKSTKKLLASVFVIAGMLLSNAPGVIAETTPPAPDKASFVFTNSKDAPSEGDTLTCDGVAGPQSYANMPSSDTYQGTPYLWAHWDGAPNTAYGIDTYAPDGSLIHHSSPIKPNDYRFYGFGYHGEGEYRMEVYAKNTITEEVSEKTTCKLTFVEIPDAPNFDSFRFSNSMETPDRSEVTLTCGQTTDMDLLRMPYDQNYKGITYIWAHWDGAPNTTYGIDTYAPDGTRMHHSSPIKPNYYRFYGFGSYGDGTYKMTVQAKNKNNGQLSTKTTCELTYKTGQPAAPTLVSPANNSTVDGASITQSWLNNDPSVDHYIYESYHDAAATDLRWHEEFSATSKTAVNVADATYWWRVKAVDGDGAESNWSDLWKIKVVNETEDETPPASLFSDNSGDVDTQDMPESNITETEDDSQENLSDNTPASPSRSSVVIGRSTGGSVSGSLPLAQGEVLGASTVRNGATLSGAELEEYLRKLSMILNLLMSSLTNR